MPADVHIVGSIPVDTAQEAFGLTIKYLRGYLKRMPDGDLGYADAVLDSWAKFERLVEEGAIPELLRHTRKSLRDRSAAAESGRRVRRLLNVAVCIAVSFRIDVLFDHVGLQAQQQQSLMQKVKLMRNKINKVTQGKMDTRYSP